jgi:hypothetical protein
MTIETEISEIKNFVAEVDKMKTVQAQILKDSWEGLLESFFQETTTISKVTWRQFTDSFNDGDACTFGVHELMGYGVETEGQDDDEDRQFESWSYEYAAEHAVSESDFKLFKEISSLQATLPEELMNIIYGDGFEITVSKDGVVIEETDHD